MRTTIDISDRLLVRAKRHARLTGRPLRALVEEGLRLLLETEAPRAGYTLPDLSVGDESGPNPLAQVSWADLRDTIHGGR